MSALSVAEPTTAPALLHIHQLSLSSASQRILHAIDLTVRSGERVAVLGPSGTGKSLLARALTGILPDGVACSGLITLNGHDITHRHPAQRSSTARVSMVDQDTAMALSPLHTLGQQLMMVCAGAGAATGKGCSIRWRAESLLDQVGVSRSAMQRYPAELSGGQRQRVCIAMALACDTPLLVADEPTSALDAVSQQHVLDALSDTASQRSPKSPFGMSMLARAIASSDTLDDIVRLRAKALLFITHDLRAAQRLCERAVVLHDGQVVEDVPMATLLADPQHEFSRRMVDALTREQDLFKTRLSVPSNANAPTRAT